MKASTIASRVLTALAVFSPIVLPVFAESGDLEKFLVSSAGRTVRRLPVDILPENVFAGFSTRDFADGFKSYRSMMEEVLEKSTYNCITLTLRCNPELGDEETKKAAAETFRMAQRKGIKVYMDCDPRIAREEFFRSHPSDRQSLAIVAVFPAKDSKACFEIPFQSYMDHMSAGSKNAYRPLNGRVLTACAVKRGADGLLDFSTRRPVETVSSAKIRTTRNPAKPKPGEEYTDYSHVTVKGSAPGLADDEALVVTAVSEYHSIDVFSPALIPFQRMLLERYKALGADGGMRDEWGFVPIHKPDMKTFWWSPHFEAAYNGGTGRNLTEDLPLMAFGRAGDGSRSKAICAYMKKILDRNVEIENAYYLADKELFGEDVYVVKHPTWIADICPGEYFHNGLDWWQAKRDWAQSDELMPLYAINAMAKKFGKGGAWLNEGYTPTGEQNVFRVWTYALCGGRQVYHGLYGNGPHRKLPWPENVRFSKMALLRRGNVTAQAKIRLLNLISRSLPDVATAWVFSHEGVMDWSSPGWNDHGKKEILGCMRRGHWCDAYPASEFKLGTFKVEDGYITVGAQRYKALVLHRLRPAEKAAFDGLIDGKTIRTKIFTQADAAAISAYLESIGAVRQSPLRPKTKAGPDYPEPDGTLTLIDGTRIRIRADWNNPSGLPIDETMEIDGKKTSFSANGVFAVRMENGEIAAVAGGGLKHVKGPGLSLELDEPQDVAMLKIKGKWHGVWQTSSTEKPLPPQLKALGCTFTRLLVP